MEALALGRPVISTYVAGIPELVRMGESGWLVPAGSVPALVAAMREAVTAPVEQLEQMGRAGAALVAERHDAKKEAAKLAALIEVSASRPSLPPSPLATGERG
jgi:glycosyltransferase involved in cell wall biosynthesis